MGDSLGKPALTGETVGARVLEAIEANDLAIQDVSRSLKTRWQTVQAWTLGGGMRQKNLTGLAELTGYPVSELLGEEPSAEVRSQREIIEAMIANATKHQLKILPEEAAWLRALPPLPTGDITPGRFSAILLALRMGVPLG